MFKPEVAKNPPAAEIYMEINQLLLVWTGSLLHKSALGVLIVALFVLLELGVSAGYVFLGILP